MKLIRQIISSKRFLGVALLFMCFLFYISLSPNVNKKPWYYYNVSCKQSKDYIKDTSSALKIILSELKNQNIVHFLCYGSLWGVLREQGLPPWDPSVDLCAIFDSKAPYIDIKSILNNVGITTSYSMLDGMYSLRYKEAKLTITMFEHIKIEESLEESYHRMGIRSKVLPPTIREQFPTRLLLTPLNYVTALDVRIPAPHEEFEIQKYLYPNDWWADVKPPNC